MEEIKKEVPSSDISKPLEKDKSKKKEKSKNGSEDSEARKKTSIVRNKYKKSKKS